MMENPPIHCSWNEFFGEHRETIDGAINDIYKPKRKVCPKREDVLKFTEIDMNKIKIVILGRDPYPQENVATGRAFEVNILDDEDSWNNKKINSSLKNIVKNLYKSYESEQSNEITITTVRQSIKRKEFNILRPSKLFKYWQEQGVLLLNTALTVEEGKSEDVSGSHEKIWETFTQDLLQYIDKNCNGVIWFLWGEARNYCQLINNASKYIVPVIRPQLMIK